MSNDPSRDKPRDVSMQNGTGLKRRDLLLERLLAGGRVGAEPNRPRYHGASAATDAGSGATLR